MEWIPLNRAILVILQPLKVHYHLHKGLPVTPVVSPGILFHTFTQFLNIHFIIIFAPLPMFHLDFLTNIWHLMSVPCMLLDLFTILIFNKMYKLVSSLECIVLQTSVTASSFSSDILHLCFYFRVGTDR
jgi:hypothetical protein